MGTTATPIPWGPAGGAVAHRSRVAGRGTVKPWQRLGAVIWDSQFLRVQHAVYRAAPRLAAHLDELARRCDEERRKRR